MNYGAHEGSFTAMVLAHVKTEDDSLDVPYATLASVDLDVDSKAFADWLTYHKLRMRKLPNKHVRLTKQ